MKKIILLLFLCVSLAANAQENVTHDFYIAVYYTGSQCVVMTTGVDKATVTEDDGKPVKFQNTIEMLNYLSGKGWKYVDKMTFSGGASGFLLSKETKDDNKALKDLNIENKKK
jgi:hypothetical protein